MARHVFEVVEAWTSSVELGPLVVTSATHSEVIEPGRTILVEYPEGKRIAFNTAKEAKAFEAKHGAKVRRVEP